MKKVFVKWRDATSFDYLDVDEIKKLELTISETVGFLIDETKDFVVLSFSFYFGIEAFDGSSGIKQHRKVLLIPKKQIIEMYELRRK